MAVNWLIFGLLSSPCLYLLVTLGNRPARTEADFEYGGRRLHPSQVLDSSITYSLQVAAIALFATWGYQHGAWTVMVPIFWFLGFVLFTFMLSQRFLEEFARNEDFRTLHSFIADNGRARWVCLLAALVTLTALSGPAMFEAFTVGNTVTQSSSLFGTGAGAGVALAFLAMSIVYILWGGFVGVVRLDRLQLAFGYGGFCVAFSMALWLYASKIGPENTFTIAAACAAVSSVMLAGKLYYDFTTLAYLRGLPAKDQLRASFDWIGAGGVTVSAIAFFTVALMSFSTRATQSGSVVPEGAFSHSQFGFTVLATVSLLIANGLFQFVDVTQWQRLLSIAVDKDELAKTVRILRGNVLLGGLCGSLTWVIAVLFGVFLKALFPDPNTDPFGLLVGFLQLGLQLGTLAHSVMTFIFVASLVSIMSSTVDAMVSATAFTVRNDIFTVFLNGAAGSTYSRVATIAVLVAQLVVYVVISQVASDHADAVLYVCYSFQLALLPTVLGVLSGRCGPAWARVLSIFAGCLASTVPLLMGQPGQAYELSPVLSTATAFVIYAGTGGFRQKTPAGA